MPADNGFDDGEGTTERLELVDTTAGAVGPMRARLRSGALALALAAAVTALLLLAVGAAGAPTGPCDPADPDCTRDTTPPQTTITAGPSGPTSDNTPEFSFSSSDGASASTFECRIDGDDPVSCDSPHTTPALTDGSHTFSVAATDLSGNTDTTPATRTFSVETDDDNDGRADGQDNCPAAPNPGQENADGDAQGDICDPDDDNDGDADGSDNCALNANPGQENADGDAQGDACDPDDDNDGRLDGQDNCQFAPNPGQEDADGDGLGNACEPRCSNIFDDDLDGSTDYPADPGCASGGDDSESPNPGEKFEEESNNSKADADARSIRITGDDTYSGAIASVGDQDFFRVEVSERSTVQFKMNDGTGSGCPAEDSVLKVYSGRTIFVDVPGKCSTWRAHTLVPGTHYVSVEESGNNAAIPAYKLTADFSPPPPMCSDSVDNDSDAKTDYPNDPGCESRTDEDETNPAQPRQCSDTIDNDVDGKADFLSAFGSPAESSDLGCSSAADDSESPDPPQCSDVFDNDADGKRDFGNDPGCSSASDKTESPNPGEKFEEESNNSRADADARSIRIVGDDGFTGAINPSEDRDFFRVNVSAPSKATFTAKGSHGGCNTSSYPYGGSLTLRTSIYNGSGAFLASGGPCQPLTRTMTVGTYYVAVDSSNNSMITGYKLTADFTSQCSDSIDNDADAKVDHPNDPGCESPEDETELNPPGGTQCSDAADNDSDGSTDYPADADCSSAGDNSEGSALQCSDAIDNDSDGKTDFGTAAGNDPGCSSAADDSEAPNPPQCSDGQDNDGDAKIDFGTAAQNDAGCESATDDSEAGPFQCSDGTDNDADGKTDHPADQGCTDSQDDTEAPDAPLCSDRLDNDSDGKQNFPADQGCENAEDDTEAPDAPQCSDRLDNDSDGKQNSDDPGCSSASDNSESPDPLPPDTTAPNTAITSGPSGTVTDRSASFGLSSTEASATLECSLDGGAFSACSSPKAYSGLADGTHVFKVRAQDAAGNLDASPAERSWKVDATKPTVTTISPTAGKTGVAPTANVLATFSEPMRASTLTKTTVKLVRKGTAKPLAATLTYDAARRRATLNPTSALARRTIYTATVSPGVKDLAGNPLARAKSWSFTVRR